MNHSQSYKTINYEIKYTIRCVYVWTEKYGTSSNETTLLLYEYRS